MKIEEALQYADQWAEGYTFHEGSQGWRVVCATLAAEVRRLQVSSQPLTDEQIDAIADPFVCSVGSHWEYEPAVRLNEIELLVRAIEAAHGIVEEA